MRCPNTTKKRRKYFKKDEYIKTALVKYKKKITCIEFIEKMANKNLPNIYYLKL